ncbi:hypothetical protein SAMN05216223_13265 [Actinacidiphila yanglinensis]|uniref:Uncharacterized protein n=1 Tax=Actinacidiphila yanglinensis TaxID=310779 RepID=A0A1H6EBP3_9ACTN|nr:hypothetical protein [Actinacidiphila yanglinensis]SEG95210.1 hypothetical protein SAMN05216223_13265 [Actinacidiphila yanglinensis]
MADPLTALAMTGATTLVASMATSAWQSARSRTAALFHRGGEDERLVGTRLDRSAARVEGAAETDGVRDGQIGRWRDDFEDLLRDHPEAEGELRGLIQEIQRQLPPVRQQWVQHITARDGGSAYGAQGPGSSVNVHHHADSGHQLPLPHGGPADPPGSPGSADPADPAAGNSR